MIEDLERSDRVSHVIGVRVAWGVGREFQIGETASVKALRWAPRRSHRETSVAGEDGEQ